MVMPTRTAYSASRCWRAIIFFKPNHIVVKADHAVEILASREAGMAA